MYPIRNYTLVLSFPYFLVLETLHLLYFEQYLSSVIPTMDRAAKTCASINSKDEDIIDYGNRRTLSILEGYRGLILGFEKNLPLMRSPAAKFLHFVKVIVRDEHRDEDVIKAVLTVICDVVSSQGSEMTLQFNDNLHGARTRSKSGQNTRLKNPICSPWTNTNRCVACGYRKRRLV